MEDVAQRRRRHPVKVIGLTVLGWLLVLAGIAALVLPGPGLVLLFVGLLVLSQQYEWAERRVEPVRLRALQSAADGVQTWPRIIASLLGVALLVGLGIYWISAPPAPDHPVVTARPSRSAVLSPPEATDCAVS